MSASAGDAHPFPIFGARFRVYFPIFDADGDLVTGAAGLDSEVSQDAQAFADAANEATELAASSGMYYLDLVGSELDTACSVVVVKTSTSGAKTTPMVFYPRKMPVLRTGTAQAGAAATITLDAGASTADDFYNGCIVNITNNSPANAQGQARRITDYVGSTRVASVASNWGTNPSNASNFEILLPGDVVQFQQFGGTEVQPLNAGYPRVDLGVGAVNSTTVADNTITANKIAADAITAAKIAANAITAAKFAADAITAAAFAADAAAEIAAAIETALVNEGDMTAVLEAIRVKIETSDDDLTVALIRDAILDRVLPGNHDGSSTVGAYLQQLNASISSRMATFTLPANFSLLAINGTGHVSRVTLVDTLTTYTGNTPQTGDAFGRLATYRLDQIFTADVTAPVAGSLAGDLTEDNAGTRRFTTPALVNAPGGGAADPDVSLMADRFLPLLQSNGAGGFQYTANALLNAPAGAGGGGGFTGPNAVTLNFRDAGAVLVPGVTFTVVGVGSALAATGNLVVGLGAGTFTVRASPQSGVLFADTVIVVPNGGGTFTITGTAQAVGSPATPGQVRGYVDCYDPNGALKEGMRVEFQMAESSAASGTAWSRRIYTTKSPANGRLERDFPPGKLHRVRFDGGAWVEFTTPAAGTFAIPGVVGRKDE